MKAQEEEQVDKHRWVLLLVVRFVFCVCGSFYRLLLFVV
jgi:hypothetical protein